MADTIFNKVTLNCDMGESFGLYKMGNDVSMLDIIDLANVACGFHAGDFTVIANTVKEAKLKGIQVGAHPSFPDLQGFGRREMKLTPEEVKHSLMYQVGALKGFLKSNDMILSHIKPHGSLYCVATVNENICRAILDVCLLYGVPLVGMPGTLHESLAKESNIPFLAEFFVDLDYDDNGSLIITREHEPVEPKVAAERAKNALHGKYFSVSGKEFEVHPKTICVHSDTPGAVDIAKAVRSVVDKFNLQGQPTNDAHIKTILVANRGEIACRIIRTCQQMNIKTVAIYESEDENAIHSLHADESVELHDGQTYTSIDAIIQICKQRKVDAVHPGYGFLSENPKFCEALEANGIQFLGPTSQTMQQFGLKHISRELAQAAGVPIISGSGLLTGTDHAIGEAQRLSFPVMLKATGGGGGIGMQICQDESMLITAVHECQSMAEKHFGKSGVYLEKYYPSSRHIEVQIFGDGHGQVIHLGERECSVQRRHQKVIEETPSPFLMNNKKLRNEILNASVRLSKSVNYRSAGTVEFLVVDEGPESDNTGKFFFLEMNTRLQVEHGVTEMVNDIDIVEWMINLGNGQLDLSTYECKPRGHSIEVRIYAENPALSFQPSPGLLTKVEWPDISPKLRVDTWVKSGTTISTNYDPLLAKMIVYGKNREDAISILLLALRHTTVAGPFTNLEYLSTVIQHEDFMSGNTTTQILKRVVYTPRAIRVIKGGAEITIQDWPGRMAIRVYGIQPNGPMDNLAFRVANILVGNKSGTAGLEIVRQGPQLYFYKSCLVAVTGANMTVTLSVPGSEPVQKQTWSRFLIPAGSTLIIGKVTKGSPGLRCYMAIYGGLDVPDYLSSKSTFSAFGYGGVQGRALQAGDMLPLALQTPDKILKSKANDMHLVESLIPHFQTDWHIMVMPGPHADPDYVMPEGMDEIFDAKWKIHYNSAKMGVRLIGPTPQWARTDGGDGGTHPSNIHDVGYGLGSINFTGDSGVVLTCDGPTQGGFACPWCVISAEMWKLGQLCAENTVSFVPVTLADAMSLRRELDDYLVHIEQIATFHPMSVPIVTFPYVTNISKSISDARKPHRECAILDELHANPETNLPHIQYRQSGDCYVLIEYGDPKASVDLNVFARVRVLQDTLRLHTDTKTQQAENPLIPGTIDAAPCLRSLLIRYDALVVPQSTLVQYLKALELDIPDIRKVIFPSREIRMPLAFDDRWSKEATMQYMKLVRKEANYLPSNVDFIAKNNGLVGGKSDVFKHVIDTPLLNVGVGFFLGCPFLCSVNPLDRLKVPKYNPSRVYTAAGTVGMGGSVHAIYPLESPGGYQMYGRTIPTWDTFGSVQPFTTHQPWLLTFFDQVTFYQVREDELLHYRKLALAGKYKYDIHESVFDMAEYNELASKVAGERYVMDKKHREASAQQKTLETELLKKAASESSDVTTPHIDQMPDNMEACQALIPGCVKDVRILVGDTVTADESVLCVLEAMKTEMEVISEVSGKVIKILVSSGQHLSSVDIVCIIET